jgi:hypothetical protein
MSRDPRYSTAAWQRLRRAVLERDGYACRIEGPRCRGHATTAHHIVPSSQAPHLFWEPSKLAAACGRCNYGDGASIAAENTRQKIAMLEEVIWRQDAEIARLSERLALCEDANGVKRRRKRRSSNERIAVPGAPPRCRHV